jgi:c-di-GMP-binding flagellar brake protein YcgR
MNDHQLTIAVNVFCQLKGQRGKLADSRNAEMKELKTELSATRIDLTMLQLKMKANEERVERDEKVTERRFRMRFLSVETAHQNEIETLEADFEEKEHNLMMCKKCSIMG